MGRGGPPGPEVVDVAPTVDDSRRSLALGAPRGVRPSRDRGVLGRHHDRLPAGRGRAGRRPVRLERARGCPPRRGAIARRDRLRRQRRCDPARRGGGSHPRRARPRLGAQSVPGADQRPRADDGRGGRSRGSRPRGARAPVRASPAARTAARRPEGGGVHHRAGVARPPRGRGLRVAEPRRPGASAAATSMRPTPTSTSSS